MPELVIPVDGIQASMKFTFEGDPEPMLIGFGGQALAEVDAFPFATALADAWETEIAPQWSDQINLTSIELRSNAGTVGEFPFDRPGAVGGDVQTPNTALLVKKVTTRPGRSGRGRIYLPGLVTASVSNAGVIDSAQRLTWQTNWMAFLASVNAALDPARLVLFHTDDPDVDPTPSVITGLIVDGKAATQRRRLRP